MKMLFASISPPSDLLLRQQTTTKTALSPTAAPKEMPIILPRSISLSCSHTPSGPIDFPFLQLQEANPSQYLSSLQEVHPYQSQVAHQAAQLLHSLPSSQLWQSQSHKPDQQLQFLPGEHSVQYIKKYVTWQVSQPGKQLWLRQAEQQPAKNPRRIIICIRIVGIFIVINNNTYQSSIPSLPLKIITTSATTNQLRNEAKEATKDGEQLANIVHGKKAELREKTVGIQFEVGV